MGMALMGMATTGASLWACDLKVDSAWIREAPPTATMLAGYAVLNNTGGKSLTIISIESPAFTSAALHETVVANGIASMQAIEKLTIAASDKAELTPRGKHLMLTKPKQALKKGDAVVVKFKDDKGCITQANFKVMADADADQPMGDMPMDHAHMHHEM
jgi:hypothetical protein